MEASQHTSPGSAPERPPQCDALVVGCGRAGSTAAAVLARRGWQAVIAENDRHPRFHIGESLQPANISLGAYLVVDSARQARDRTLRAPIRLLRACARRSRHGLAPFSWFFYRLDDGTVVRDGG